MYSAIKVTFGVFEWCLFENFQNVWGDLASCVPLSIFLLALHEHIFVLIYLLSSGGISVTLLSQEDWRKLELISLGSYDILAVSHTSEETEDTFSTCWSFLSLAEVTLTRALHSVPEGVENTEYTRCVLSLVGLIFRYIEVFGLADGKPEIK